MRALLDLLGIRRKATPSPYKVEGYAQTRDALVWIKLSAPNFPYGLTLEQLFAGLEHGYHSVRPQLKDRERILQWEQSLQKMREAYALFQAGDLRRGKRTMQDAEELFVALRRIKGQKVSRQELAETEHGANELDEE
jgi:hypothetical protein